MNIIYYFPFILLNFIIGTFFGSFFNCVILRLHTGQKWWGNERSRCDACRHTLSFFDLIPIASYLFRRGKCGYCGERIDKSHIIAEIFSGVGFAVISTVILRHYSDIQIIITYITALCLIFNSISDLNYRYTYTVTIYPSCILVLALNEYFAYTQGSPMLLIIISLVQVAVVALTFFILSRLLRKKMGGGDFDILFLIFLATDIMSMFYTIFYASAIGLLIIIPLIISKKMDRKSQIPFVPLIQAGYLILVLTKAL